MSRGGVGLRDAWSRPCKKKITVAECIETQSKAMTMLNIEQLSYLLKFALQKMKQPGTEPFQKPVSLEQHPDYAEYIFHPMDLCTLEKVFSPRFRRNHKLTATAKVIVKICEHEMNEIEVCPECYLSACQKRDNWFCEPCSNPHPLVWAKLKGFPFWPAKALRDKDGQVDARFFGQHDSAMQEMEIYVETFRKKFGVFNYAPFRTPYTPDNQFQMLLDPSNPSAGSVRPERQEKLKLSFDMSASPKVLPGRAVPAGRRVLPADAPRSPASTNSSAHTGSDGEQEASEKGGRASSGIYSTGEESMDCTAVPLLFFFLGPNPTATVSPAATKPFSPPAPTPIAPKQERPSSTGSILNLNLDRSKAEMDLKELSETVQQQHTAPVVLTSPKRQIRSHFQLNLDKTIESCKAQLGIDEISEDVYKGVEHSDSEDSDNSDSSDPDYASDEEQKPKGRQSEEVDKDGPDKDTKKKGRAPPKDEDRESVAEAKSGAAASEKVTSVDESLGKESLDAGAEKETLEKAGTGMGSSTPPAKEKPRTKEEGKVPAPSDLDQDSDSERELVIDLGDDQTNREHKKTKKEPSATASPAEPSGPKPERKRPPFPVSQCPLLVGVKSAAASSAAAPPTSDTAPSTPSVKDPAQSPVAIPLSMVSFTATTSAHLPQSATASAAPSSTPSGSTSSSPATKDVPLSVSSSPMTLVTSASTVSLTAGSGSSPSSLSSSATGDLQIATTSADVAADIAKYTNKIMDAIKGTMTEMYNDLSKSTSGNTIAEIRRLRIEIEKLQWLHQQELSEMKHNLELTMAEMRQSLEQERERMVAEVRKQMELERQQAVDETKKKQWCASCKKEAIFYCCWNTSYCDYPCQQAHWPEHMKSCTQSAASQQDPEPEAEADPGTRSTGQPPSGQLSPKEGAAAAPADKDSSMERGKDSTPVTASPDTRKCALVFSHKHGLEDPQVDSNQDNRWKRSVDSTR
ncbi:protein kinase C-binding protein 1-like, partial [Scleropages formosus]